MQQKGEMKDNNSYWSMLYFVSEFFQPVVLNI